MPTLVKALITVLAIYLLIGILVAIAYHYVRIPLHQFSIKEDGLAVLIWPIALLYVIFPNSG